MSLTTRVGLLVGATALTLTGAGVAAPATQGTNDDMAQRLAAAEAKIAAMEAASNENWLTEQRASEIRGLVQDVLADADTRASLLQSGITSGYDNGMVLGSSDGNWLLRTNFHMQQRFIYNDQDDASASEGDSNRWGFENTRSKFMLSGNVVNPDWFYLVEINVGSNGGSSTSPSNSDSSDREGTGSAYLGYDYGNGWSLRMGSMKTPGLREELVASQYQLAVERSSLNYLFTGGYADGLTVDWESDQFRVSGMISDGARTGQTIWSTYDTEFALSGRVEFMLSGNWDQFKDFTSMKDDETGVLLGAAAHYQQGEFGTTASEVEVLGLTGDVSIEFGGANLYGAFVWADLDVNGAPIDFSPFGFLIQGGFFVADSWELFGRYEWVDLDIDGLSNTSILTAGVNKYISGHNAKWTTDVGYALDDLQSFSALGTTVGVANITGFRPDGSDEDGQFVIRTQLQILF